MSNVYNLIRENLKFYQIFPLFVFLLKIMQRIRQFNDYKLFEAIKFKVLHPMK